jgi:hypothetical protein
LGIDGSGHINTLYSGVYALGSLLVSPYDRDLALGGNAYTV